MSRGFIRPTEGGTLLSLRVSPGSKRTSIEGLYGEDALKLRVAAPPVDGKANAEVERFLAGLAGLPRSGVGAVRDLSSRDKVVLLKDAGQAQVRDALAVDVP